MVGNKLLRSCQHGIQDRGLVTIKANALLLPGQHLALLIHQAQFDCCSANIDAEILFHSSPLFIAPLRGSHQ